MKKLIVIFFLFSIAKAQTVINVSNFGAISGDGLNDYAALKRISDTINAHGGGYIVNFITNGQYNYRPPHLDIYPDSVITGIQWDVLSLVNCSNVIINLNGSTIKLMDSVPLGVKPGGGGASAFIGSLFRFTGCSGITLSNGNGDGNMNGMRLLGNYGSGSNPYELEHEGIFIYNSRDVNILDCNFYGFARDGILLLQDTIGVPNNNIYLYNSSFNYNGRNGISWTGGDSLLVRKCTFKGNGQGRISESPAAGLDIEPERGSSCVNGRFVNTIFENNNGYSITAGYPTTSRHMIFDSCKIRNPNNYTLFTNAPFFKFLNSEIYGTVLLNYSVFSGGDSSTYFYKCRFIDSLTGYINTHINYTAPYMVALADSIRFSHCDWYSWTSAFAFSTANGARFDTCNFYAMFKKDNGYGANCFLLFNTIYNKCFFGYKLFPDYNTVLLDGARFNILVNCSYGWIDRYSFSTKRRLRFISD